MNYKSAVYSSNTLTTAKSHDIVGEKHMKF